MNRYAFFIALLISSAVFSQIKIEGVVRDSIGNPLELANVIAINEATQGLESFGVTNEAGRYKLALKRNTIYKIQISYIGKKTAEESITTEGSDITKDFVLKNDKALDAVELTYEMPVTIKGDTIVYNADSFKDGTERKLGDVLEKLPGVEINDEGQIEVEGKTVGKVMVEGKDFFDGDSKLATENIPANAVDKVEVLKNFAEVGQLSGVQNNQDNIALNIKLKEGKKNFWFGDITAGGGDSDDEALYLVQPKLFYYSPKYSINIIGDLNNLGEVAFTRRDFFNFTGGFRAPSRQSGTNINLGNNNLGFLNLQNNRARNIETKFGAANFSYSPKKTLDLSGFGIFTSSRTDLLENNAIQYTNSDLGIPDEETQNNTEQRSDLGMLKLSAKYKPNVKNQLDYDILGRLSKESQDQQFLSSVTGNTEEFEETQPFSINQNLDYYYTLDDTNIFALSVQHLLQDEDPFYNAIIEKPSDPDDDNYLNTATGLGLDLDQINYNVAQDNRVKSNQLDAKLDYWNVLNKKSNINFTLGTIYSRQDFDSNIFQFLDNGSTLDPTPTINNGEDTNDTEYTFSDIYLGAHYRFITGIFTFTPGISLHAYNTKNTQFGETTQDDFFRLLPDFNLRLQLKKSEQLILDYRLQTEFTDVTQLARGLVLNNFNSIFSGNQALDNALSHNINLSYFSFNLFNYTNVFANVNYQKSIDQIRNLTNFESVIRFNSPFNSSFADENLNVRGRVQRRFGKFQLTANASFNYSMFNQFVQDERSVNENYNQTYRLGVRTRFRNAPNVRLEYSFSVSDNDQGDTRTKFFTNAPSIEFDALLFKKFTFKTEYAYNRFSNEDETLNTFDFWDASLSYRKDQDSKWEYEVKATNLLNTESQNQTTTNAISVSASEYFIQPRFVSFRLRYNL